MDIVFTLDHLAESAPHFLLQAAQSRNEALSLLKRDPAFDLVVLNGRMSDGSALECLREVRYQGIDLPFVVIAEQGVLSAVNRLIRGGGAVPVERCYSFPVGIFTREVKGPPSSSDLGKG
jgi:DNA-binding NtrC family response regulator